MLFRSFPPLPDRSGGLFLLHLSEGRPWRVLPVILALWSPDFPHAQPFGSCPRLSGPLAGDETQIELPQNADFSISGDNDGGFIVTLRTAETNLE